MYWRSSLIFYFSITILLRSATFVFSSLVTIATSCKRALFLSVSMANKSWSLRFSSWTILTSLELHSARTSWSPLSEDRLEDSSDDYVRLLSERIFVCSSSSTSTSAVWSPYRSMASCKLLIFFVIILTALLWTPPLRQHYCRKYLTLTMGSWILLNNLKIRCLLLFCPIPIWWLY